MHKKSSGWSNNDGRAMSGVSAQKRGAWLPKVANLVVAIYKKQWKKAQALCEEYVRSSFVLKGIVDSKMSN